MELNTISGPKASLSHNVWLISFGDLLTLVLCFFISVISLSPLNPERKVVNQTGTAIAPIKADIQAKVVEQHSKNLDISFSDVSASGLLLGTAAVERLKTQVSQDTYAVKGLKVETCLSSNESDLAGTLNEPVRLLSNIRRQVIDGTAGLSGKKIMYRTAASGCEANTAARLVLEF